MRRIRLAATAVALGALTSGGLAQTAQAKLIADLPALRCFSGDLKSFVQDAFTTLERDEALFPASASARLNAMSTNGRMGAGLLRDGTLAVLRWPTVLSYQQVKWVSRGTKRPLGGARPNAGVLLGVVVGNRTVWLREFADIKQQYVSDVNDEIETVYTDAKLGLTVTVRHVVPPDADVYVQRVTVRRAPGATAPSAVMAFENLSANNINFPAALGPDGCADDLTPDTARYSGAGAIVHWRYTKAFHSGKQDNIALAMAATTVDQWHVGLDRDADTLGRPAGWRDAYDDAEDGRLTGNRGVSGQTTGALRSPLRFVGDEATTEVAIAGARDAGTAIANARTALTRGQPAAAQAKAQMYAARLAKAPMPDTDDAEVLRLARRSLITVMSVASPTGAQAASIAHQPAYAFDWPRDGAYRDRALDMAGMHDLVRAHKRFYIRTQRRPGFKVIGDLGVPMGSWPMNMYEDGTNAGPLRYEIDETGMTAWGLWDHYLQTKDRAYLLEAWPAIRLAAQHFVVCRDRYTNLQCKQLEGDQAPEAVSIAGAMPAMQALISARDAAKELGLDAEAARFSAREVEFRAAFEKYLWDEKLGRYDQAPLQKRRGDQRVQESNMRMAVAYLGYPVQFNPPTNDRMRRHYDTTWEILAPSFDAPNGPRKVGFYEQLGLLTLAHVSKDNPARMAEVRRGLSWIANVQALDTATLGESWIVRNGEVVPVTATPHSWEHALFYLASVEAYGVRK